MRRLAVILLAPLIAGCPPPKPRPDAALRTLEEIERTISDNAHKMNRPLYAPGSDVAGKNFRDAKGKRHSFNLNADLLFQRPRSLRIDLSHGLAGGDPVLQIGSNAEEYWLWSTRDATMHWGLHRNIGKPCADTIGLRPDLLTLLLGLSNLPNFDLGLRGPRPRVTREHDILTYWQADSSGRAEFMVELWVDRWPPHLPQRIVLLDGRGAPILTSLLDKYEPAWENGPLIARRVRINWIDERSELRLWFDAVEGKTADEVSPRAFVLPTPDGKPRLPSEITQVIQTDSGCKTAGGN